jgi:NAD(P) transhydrogenase subunit beta
MDGLLALYIFMLAAFTGYEIIAKVPVILHTPLMSGSNFVHGVVVVGAMLIARHGRHRAATGHRLLRRGAGRRQCRRRLRRHRAHARHVQEEGRLIMTLPIYVQGAWFLGALLFIFGLKGMSSPASARKGIVVAGYGMLIAIAATFLVPGLKNLAPDGCRPRSRRRRRLDLRQEGQDDRHAADGRHLQRHGRRCRGRRLPPSSSPRAMPQHRHHGTGCPRCPDRRRLLHRFLRRLGQAAGGLEEQAIRLPAQNAVNVVLALNAVGLGIAMVVMAPAQPELIVFFFAISLILGLIVTLPIGGADMPVVISLFNAFTGLAVGFEGYVLGNPALIIAGIVVGAAGTLLTQLMAKAMNRPISNILFTPMVASGAGEAISGTMKEVGAIDAAAMMRYASKVIIVPGYGMAVAHAQHKVWEMTVDPRRSRGRGEVRHPPGGRPHAGAHERAAWPKPACLTTRSSTWKRSTASSARPTWR